ncbi:MAG: hypothetical protein Tsb009_20570 [Planctomycetaceae bacterium]
MAGRLAWGLLIASALICTATSGPLYGQSWSPGGMYGGMPAPMTPTAMPYGVPPQYSGMPPAGMVPVSAYSSYPSGYVNMSPGSWCPDGNCGDGSQFVTTRVPADIDRLEATPLERILRTAARNSWIRLEYLNWSLSDTDETLLGERTLNTANPRVPFATLQGVARALDTTPLSFKDISGVRGTWGVPLTFGEFELSAFLLEQDSDKVIPSTIPSPGLLVATTVLGDGGLISAVRVYDKAFEATFTSDVWGAKANIILDTAPPGEGFKLRPLYGVRYLGIQEQLTQVGTFNGNATINDFTSVIDSDNFNNIYGLNIGLQAELVHRWFTIGVRPEVTLGANSYQARVRTDRFVSPTDPTLVSEISGAEFAPVGELGVYGRIRVNDSFSLFVSYNLLYATRVIRPHKSINYNVNTVLTVPVSSAFSAKKVFEEMLIQGLTVGGEIRFR